MIIHPNLSALRNALDSAGVKAPSDDDDLCVDSAVQTWLLSELKEKNMLPPTWKGYEVARNVILDSEEWTTDNDLLTPSLKVKLRNLLVRHEESIAKLRR